jgi:hypothetical protein
VPSLTVPFQAGGPLIDILVGVSAPHLTAIQQASGIVPTPIKARALVDTGASCTCIDPDILSQLNLTPTGAVPMQTPTTAGTPVTCSQYDVGLAIPVSGGAVFQVRSLGVIESKLKPQGFDVLIGRDVLSRALLVYHGALNLLIINF